MPNRRLLDIRLQEMRQDVTKVKSAVALAASRHQLARALHGYIDMWGERSVLPPLNRALMALTKLPTVLQQAGDNLPALVKYNGIDLGVINSDLEAVASGLNAAQQALREAGAPVELDEQRRDALKKNLEACDDIIWSIEDLHGKLEQAGDVRALWTDFDTLRVGQCEALFADYVDFLSGLTLRDNHFDDRIGDLTDAFLQDLGAVRLAIPARGPARPSVLDVLMKLGFPEWTLWDVPMAAYEVALKQEANSVVANRLLPQRLTGREVAQEEVLFADAYAAFLVGPAYACSAVLLFMRPDRRATERTPDDLDRAHVIFRLLDRVQSEGEFAVDTDLVRESWDSAATELVGSARPDNADALDRFVDEIYRKLMGTVATAGFDPARREFAIKAFEPVLASGDEQPSYTGKVLDLLNAAWSAWLRNRAAPDDIERRALGSWVGPVHPVGGSNPTGVSSMRSDQRGRF